MSQSGPTNGVQGTPSVATSYVTDSGIAIPAVNVLNILGGTDIATAGAGNTVTIAFTGAPGGVTSVTGTANEVLVNGTSGIATGGALLLTTPQQIGTSSTVQFGSLSVGGAAVSSAILSAFSTTKGFLPPSMTTTQKNAIVSPATGLIVYDNVINDLQYYNGAAWISGGGVTSAQGTAPIQVNGLSGTPATGALTISATEATTSNLGVASFNSTNFTVTAGAVNTIQNINTGASPQFVGLNLSGLTASQAVVTDGSKNLASLAYSITSSASSLVERDADQNAFANSFTSKAINVVSAGATTTLTSASARWQNLTGTSAQTFQLPNATTLSIGARFDFNNNSTGLLTLKDGGGTILFTVPSGGQGYTVLLVNVVTAGVWDYHFTIPSNIQWGTSSLVAPSTTLISAGQFNLTGTSSGTISILPQAAAGTFNFNLPITAGTSGYLLTSGGGVGSPMTWTNPASIGGVTSVSGTANQIAASPTTGAVVVSLTNGISIGSYQGTSPPTGGIIAPGQVAIGTSSPAKQLNILDSLSSNTAQIKTGAFNATAFSYYGNFASTTYISTGGTYATGWVADTITNTIPYFNIASGNATSYITFGTSTTNNAVATETARFTDNQGLGIGYTTAPNNGLAVLGNVGIGNTGIANSVLTTSNSSANTTLEGDNQQNMLTMYNSSNTTNNWTTICFRSQSAAVAGAIGFQNTDQTNAYGDIAFATRSAAGFSEKMRIISTGGVGINRSTAFDATTKLSIASGLLIADSSTKADIVISNVTQLLSIGSYYTSGVGSYGAINSAGNGAGTAGALVINQNSGNVSFFSTAYPLEANLFCGGTWTAVVGGSIEGNYFNQTLKPASSVTSATHTFINPIFDTTTAAMTTSRSLWVNSNAKVGANTITNAYSLYVADSVVGSTSNTALYSVNAAIGSFTAVSPPSNGLIVSGKTIIGSSASSVSNSLLEVRGGWFYQTYNTGTLPGTVNDGGFVVGWNHSQSRGEVNFFNVYNAYTADVLAYDWWSINSGASALNQLMALYTSGGLSIGKTYAATAAPANGLIVSGVVGIGVSAPFTASNNTLQIGSIGTVLQYSQGMQNTYFRIRELNFTDNIGLATNISNTSVQDDVLKSSWVVEFGAGSDNFRVIRFTPGLTSNADLFHISSNGNVGINDTAPGSKLSVVGNAQIGFASATAAPSSGLIVSGQVGINTSSVSSSALIQFSASSSYPYLVYATGSMTAIDGGNNQLGFFTNLSMAPTNTAGIVGGIVSEPSFVAASTKTITRATALQANPVFSSNVGTITAGFGLYIGAGTSNTGTLTTGYGIYINQPSYGTTAYAASIQGGIVYKYRAVSTTATVATSDYIVAAASYGSPFTISLPSTIPDAGWTCVIKDANGTAATNNVTVSGNGHNIDGSSTYVIFSDYQSITVYSDGSNYFII